MNEFTVYMAFSFVYHVYMKRFNRFSFYLIKKKKAFVKENEGGKRFHVFII